MLKTGKDHLEGLRDGRTIYIGSEKVTDVTTHPAFAHAAQTIAGLYDAKCAKENLDLFSYEEDGERYSLWYLRAKTKDDHLGFPAQKRGSDRQGAQPRLQNLSTLITLAAARRWPARGA